MSRRIDAAAVTLTVLAVALSWTGAANAAANAAAKAAAARPDVLVADFEGKDYGAWKTTGEAFGPGPARGTLPGQMAVSGFEGKGLVNTFYKGDGTTGTLTSPPFTIERTRINFLLGGGMHPGQTCINLLVDGKTARTATGPNDRPGGTERLDWHSWDVADLEGKKAVVQIVDKHSSGWGHINVDHIVQSDRRKGVVETIRKLRIGHAYIRFCFGAGQGQRSQVTLRVDGNVARSSAGTGAKEPCWISWDVSQLKGKDAELKIAEMPAADGSLPLADSAAQSDEPKGIVLVVDKLYHETYRPQFHFTPQKNWHNDPNGLVFYKGEYHLFFQHNPKSKRWGNMTWGHAVGPDLVHWTQLPHAIYPDKLGTIFSGSAVVDHNNTAGFQTGDEKVIVCIYTSAGRPFTQSIAYSNDRGRTWTKYPKNPVLGHIIGSNRDPKVLWHEPTRKWIMALFLHRNDYALFASPDLKAWTKLSDAKMPGSGECPDFFELPVDGDPKKSKWVFWGGNGNYRLGAFDGKTFTPETQPLRSEHGPNCYAAQTWSDIPPEDGRRLLIGWMRGGRYPNMPFNQQMSFPRRLTLRTFAEGIRLCHTPVKEIETLHGKRVSRADVALNPGENPLEGLSGELLDVRAEIEPGKASEVGLTLRGVPVEYAVKAKELRCRGRKAALEPIDGTITLQILVDRTSVEVFANGGKVVMSFAFPLSPQDRSLAAFAREGKATLKSLDLWELKSIWP